MVINYPINFADYKGNSFDSYIMACKFDLYMFQMFLRSNIIKGKWNNLNNKKQFLGIPNEFDMLKFPNFFINNLRFEVDRTAGICYYYIPDSVRLPKTNITISKISRIIEYGNDRIAPLGWIRHSYIKFYDYLVGK